MMVAESLYETLASTFDMWEISLVSDCAMELLYILSIISTRKSLKLKTLELSWTSLCTSRHWRDDEVQHSVPAPRPLDDIITAFNNDRGRKLLSKQDRSKSNIILHNLLKSCRKVSNNETHETFFIRTALLRQMGLIMDGQKAGLDSTPHIDQMVRTVTWHFANLRDTLGESIGQAHSNRLAAGDSISALLPASVPELFSVLLQTLRSLVIGLLVMNLFFVVSLQ